MTTFHHQATCLTNCKKRRALASIIVAWEIKDLNPSAFLLHSPFPGFLLLNTASYGMGYSFDHRGFAVLAASLPIFLPSAYSPMQGAKRESLDTLQAVQQTQHSCAINAIFLTNIPVTPSYRLLWRKLNPSQPDTAYLNWNTNLTCVCSKAQNYFCWIPHLNQSHFFLFFSEFIEKVFNHEWGSNLLLQSKYKTLNFI